MSHLSKILMPSTYDIILIIQKVNYYSQASKEHGIHEREK